MLANYTNAAYKGDFRQFHGSPLVFPKFSVQTDIVV